MAGCPHLAAQPVKWALGAVLAASTAAGCQCQTADDAPLAARRPDRSGHLRCPASTAAAGRSARRQIARRRAVGFLDLRPYGPASLSDTTALAIASYPAADGALGRRSWTYDDALALLWFAWTGQHRRAAGLAETLMYLQNPDGSWGFSFAMDSPSVYQASYVRSGTVAWAAGALGFYAERYASPRAVRAARRGTDFLRRHRLAADTLGRGLVSAGYGTASTPPDAGPGRPLGYAVSEHQFDAYQVLARYHPAAARRLADRIVEVLWVGEDDYFGVAVADDHLNRRRALDAAGAWGALWLLSAGHARRARRSYRYALTHFQTRSAPADGALFGFRPYRDPIDGYDPSAAAHQIFVEGSMSMGLAAHRLGDRATARKVLATGVALSCRGASGLPYSTVATDGFSTHPSAASTLWFLFFDREMNTGFQAPIFQPIAADAKR